MAVIRIRNGKYMGFGYVDSDIAITEPNVLDEYIKHYPDNRDVQQIIRNYISNHPELTFIFPVKENR